MHKNKILTTALKITNLFFVLFLFFGQINAQKGKQIVDALPGYEFEDVKKSEQEWKNELNDQAYYVLREQGTERAFSGAYWNISKKGIYQCAACGLPLFSSEDKFKSGTGWPSFTKPKFSNVVGENVDQSFGMTRTEVHCARCMGHLGHVFADGPKPTGLRYCLNSVSLKFMADKEKIN